MEEKIVITNRLQFNKLCKSFEQVDQVEFNIQSLSSEENLKWTSEINSGINACGCETGHYFVLTSLIISVCYLGFNLNEIYGNLLVYFLKTTGFVFSMGMAGKILGLLAAKYRLRKNIEEIKRKLAKTIH